MAASAGGVENYSFVVVERTMTSRIKYSVFSALLCFILLFSKAITGCSTNTKPVLNEVSPQTATVGVEMVVFIEGHDADGDRLSFSLHVDSIPDINDRIRPARFDLFGRTSAYLRWTPMVTDLGVHEFRVRASDGKDSTSVVFPVNVRPGDAYPVFRRPLGSGTTLDLSQHDCIEIDVLVEDPDSPYVDLYLEEPIEDGYVFSQDGPMEGIFHWCPTKRQIDGAERYTLNLAADDRDGHLTRKKYVIVLRRKMEDECTGSPPSITHNPPNSVETVQDPAVNISVSDDIGLSGLPLLYYSLEQPADPANPVFSQFVQVIMNRVSGDSKNGQYVGHITNPVVADPPGTSRTVYYFFEAVDSDEELLGCYHRTRDPSNNVYSLVVTHGEGSGVQGTCGACWSDVQCGSAALCVPLGGGQSYCLPRCSGLGDCSWGSSCSTNPVTSIGGVTDRVCVPDSGSCIEACIDDVFEGNNSFDDPDLPVLYDGFYPNLKLCGDPVNGHHDDFFRFQVTEKSFVTVTLLFSHDDGDIDLSVYDENGYHLGSSYSVTDNEAVSLCLDPGWYVIHVYTFSSTIDAAYDLALTIPGGGCCVNDIHEPDNSPEEANPAQDGTIYEDMVICEGDEDWFAIFLNGGETLVVDVLFDQTNPKEDLDVYLYDTDGVTLLSNWWDGGQSGNSDETLIYKVNATGTYYVVVDGFMGSENEYMIGFTVY